MKTMKIFCNFESEDDNEDPTAAFLNAVRVPTQKTLMEVIDEKYRCFS
jgi:hypothetical protein